jgi:hypothetical protein
MTQCECLRRLTQINKKNYKGDEDFHRDEDLVVAGFGQDGTRVTILFAHLIQHFGHHHQYSVG